MSWIKLVVLGVCLLVGFTCAERVRYDNHRVYKVLPKTTKDLQYLSELEVSNVNLRFLNPVTLIGKDVNILVGPEDRRQFANYLNEREVFFELVESNFQRILDAEMAEFRTRSATYDWTGYHTLNETYDWLRSKAQEYPNVVQTIVGGRTYEGREIFGIKISYKSGNKGIFIEGGIHAREWISPATVTYIVNQLLTNANVDIRNIAENYDWYVFPHVNPDGFVYTHTHDRLWRKTRSPGTSCYGADPNRNWDVHWMEIGASDNECSGTFAGKTPFSEIEMRSLSEYIASLKGKIHTYLAFHSFGQLMLYPYGHTADPSPHDADLDKIAVVASSALAVRFGTQYKFGRSNVAIYPTSGSSVDWAYDVQGIPIAYTFELRPQSSINGFVLPSAQIIPTGQETMDSVVALIKETARLGYL